MSVKHLYGVDEFSTSLEAVLHANALAAHGVAAQVFNGATLIHAATPTAIH